MAEIPILWKLYDNAGDPLTGGVAHTSLKIRREADGYVLDWDDGIFKNAAWVSPTTQMVEDSVVPGLYKSTPDIAAWDDGRYQVIVRYDDGVDTVRNETDEFEVKDGAEVKLGSVQAKTDNLPTDPADESFIEAAIASAVSPLSIEANVQGHAANALTAYDPPTKAEMDSAIAGIPVPDFSALALEATSQELVSGLNRVLGLSQENSFQDQITYNPDMKILTARRRIYSDAASVGTDNNVIATYAITTTWNQSGTLESYKAVRQMGG